MSGRLSMRVPSRSKMRRVLFVFMRLSLGWLGVNGAVASRGGGGQIGLGGGGRQGALGGVGGG